MVPYLLSLLISLEGPNEKKIKLGIEGDLTSYLYDVLPLGAKLGAFSLLNDCAQGRSCHKDKRFPVIAWRFWNLFFIVDRQARESSIRSVNNPVGHKRHFPEIKSEPL